jgi:hypothetical protein
MADHASLHWRDIRRFDNSQNKRPATDARRYGPGRMTQATTPIDLPLPPYADPGFNLIQAPRKKAYQGRELSAYNPPNPFRAVIWRSDAPLASANLVDECQGNVGERHKDASGAQLFKERECAIYFRRGCMCNIFSGNISFLGSYVTYALTEKRGFYKI